MTKSVQKKERRFHPRSLQDVIWDDAATGFSWACRVQRNWRDGRGFYAGTDVQLHADRRVLSVDRSVLRRWLSPDRPRGKRALRKAGWRWPTPPEVRALREPATETQAELGR